MDIPRARVSVGVAATRILAGAELARDSTVRVALVAELARVPMVDIAYRKSGDFRYADDGHYGLEVWRLPLRLTQGVHDRTPALPWGDW